MATNHSPTPWILQAEKNMFKGLTTHISTEDGYAIADMAVNYSSIDSEIEHEANAAHIVKCVNEREELLKTFKEVLEIFGVNNYFHTMTRQQTQLIHKARLIVQNAEGK